MLLKLVIFCLCVGSLASCEKVEWKQSSILEQRGSYLMLQSGEVVRLAGVAIPWQGHPFNPNAQVHSEKYLQKVSFNKDIQYRIILKKRDDGYPDLNLVEIFDEKKNINLKLIQEGLAFFNYDQFKGVDIYRNLEQKAKLAKRGVWSEDSLFPLYVAHKTWRSVHFSACPEVTDLDEKEIDYFYVHPPMYLHGRGLNVYPCEFCNLIFQRFGNTFDMRNPFLKSNEVFYLKKDATVAYNLQKKISRIFRSLEIDSDSETPIGLVPNRDAYIKGL